MSADCSNPLFEEQFVSNTQQREAVTLGMWIFLTTEVLFFGGLLVVYTAYRLWYPQEFAIGSRHLDFTLGTLNTAILLTSSFFMAGAVTASRLQDRRSALIFLVFTATLGVTFLTIKGHEWHRVIEEGFWPAAGSSGLSPGTHLFYSLYFALTGLHGLHVFIGVGIMTWSIGLLARRRSLMQDRNFLSLLGLYWHFVDIIWIFLYPLLYFIGRSS